MSTKLESQASFEATLFGLLHRQFTHPEPLPAGIQLTDQVAIVTGSNVGLGLEASRQLLQLGLSGLVMGVRSQAKGDSAAAQLRNAFPSATISVWVVDLESYDSIRAFADQCATLPRIDIAILSAGLMNTTYTTVPVTKHEITMQVNYLSTALLAILLLPLLRAKRAARATRPPVLTIVGSDAAYGADLETAGPVLQQLDNPKAFSQLPWYSKSKLLLVLFVSKLAELVSSDEVLVNIVNPGMTGGTAFFRRVPAVLLKLVAVVQFLLARPVAVGASTYIHATVAQGKESHGSFISDWAIKP
jgi:NAD(P)-dependent dehydrogenase (short-subunit alcohol dehydrogenase family)